MNEDNLSTAALRENLSSMVTMSNQFSEELRTLLAQYPAHIVAMQNLSQQISDCLSALMPQIQMTTQLLSPAILQMTQGTAKLLENIDFKALMGQIDTTMQQLSATVPTVGDTVEVESTLSEFEETLDQVSSQLPQGTVDEVKANIVEPLKEKSHLSLSDSISLLGLLITVILWVLTQILPNAQLQEIVEGNGQISEQLQQSNELDEQLVETVQVLRDKVDTLSDKLDVLIEQSQNTDDLPDLPENPSNTKGLDKATDAQNEDTSF
ncbi:MAG: hypothetical protein PUE97_02670 [Subdoligranulum variabile]|nr:hypothetical protein [Subdoligranulum variabile]